MLSIIDMHIVLEITSHVCMIYKLQISFTKNWLLDNREHSIMQMNIWKIVYLNCGERYDFMIDRRSYTHNLVGGHGGHNLPPPVPCSPASRTFISRFPPFSVLLPSPVNWQGKKKS